MRKLPAPPRYDFRDVIRHQILMRHRQQRQIDARHRPHFARPKPARVYQMLGDDRALFGHNFPRPVSARICLQYPVVQDNFRAAHLGGLRIGMRGAVGVQMPIQRIV